MIVDVDVGVRVRVALTVDEIEPNRVVLLARNCVSNELTVLWYKLQIARHRVSHAVPRDRELVGYTVSG